MQYFRNQINEIDQKIVRLLTKRMGVVKKIGKFKKESGLPVRDKSREKELKDGLKKIAGEKLSPKFIDEVYDIIFEEAKRIQKLNN